MGGVDGGEPPQGPRGIRARTAGGRARAAGSRAGTSLYVLDTDTPTLFQHGHVIVTRRCAARPPGEVAITVISVEEQLEGRLILLCQLRWDAFGHGHELTRQPFPGRLDAEPVADQPVDRRAGGDSRRRSRRGGKSPPRPNPGQRVAAASRPPIPPRGKKPAAGDPGGTVPAVVSIPATPGSCRPASRTPHGGGSPATAGPDTGPSPRAPWPPHDTAPPNAADGRIPPAAPTAHPLRSCSSSIVACHRRRPRRSANPLCAAPTRSHGSC